MSRWRSEPLALNVQGWRARARVLLSRGRRALRTWRQPAWVCLVPEAGATGSPMGAPGHDEALLQWRRWCQAHEGQHVRVGLSARWLLSSAVMHEGARGQAALQQALVDACARWGHLLGLDEAAWQARWVARAVVLPQGVLVCAVPRALVDDVLAVAAHHGVTLRWIGPWWAHGMRQWLSVAGASSSAVDAASRSLVMREPGWAVHAKARGQQLEQLWAEPGAGDASASSPQGVVHLASPGAAARSVWTDEAVARALSGDVAVWGALS